MRIIFDTNILIYREQSDVLDSDIAELMELISTRNINCLKHPLSVREISDCKDENIRRVNLSKLEAYPSLIHYPDPYEKEDRVFLDLVDKERNGSKNDVVDNTILYAVYKNAVDFLVTNDTRLIKKAYRFTPELAVYSVSEALDYLNTLYPEVRSVPIPLGITETEMYNVNLDDPLFDTLKDDYGEEFSTWYNKKAREGRKCYVYYQPNSQKLGCFMACKDEEEAVDCIPPLPKKKRLKIATLKVVYNGRRIGEALLSLAFSKALKNGYDEIYLTHFTEQESDSLVSLIEKYGFYKYGEDKTKYPGKTEDIFLKRIRPSSPVLEDGMTPYQADTLYYPSYYCGSKVRKFVIPIQPEYHDRLFLNTGDRQTQISEHTGNHCTEGYAILKAYLNRAPTRKIERGDVVIFYESSPKQALTALGVVDDVLYDQMDTEEIMRRIRNRTVYSYDEVADMPKPLMIILFRFNTNVLRNINLQELIRTGVLQGAPQSILQLSEDKFGKLIELGVIDESLTIH